MGPTIVLQAFLQWEPSSMTSCLFAIAKAFLERMERRKWAFVQGHEVQVEEWCGPCSGGAAVSVFKHSWCEFP